MSREGGGRRVCSGNRSDLPMAEAVATTMTTTNRSDFTWPYLAERRRIFRWDRYEYRRCRSDVIPPVRQRFIRNSETLKTIPDAEKLRFDFDFRPNPILGRRPSAVYRRVTDRQVQAIANLLVPPKRINHPNRVI